VASLANAYALLIGVGNDLPVTVRDANAIRNILGDTEYAGYNPENIIILTEKEATRDGILSGFDQLIERTDENSSVLLFYSGHGGTYLDNDILPEGEKLPEEQNKRHYYLLPNNFDPTNFDETWVTANEVKEKINLIGSRRLVFLLDCCHAAGMTKSGGFQVSTTPKSQALRDPEVLAQKIEDGQGISIISSCREDQQSYILDGDTNSLFTKCLIEVLKGKHKTHFTEPFIRITEVTQYLFKRVPELIENQKPFVNLQIYDDFVLSKVPTALQGQIAEPVTDTTEPQATEIKTVFRETPESNSVILFVHGFAGEAYDTFGKTPELLMNDHRFAGWDLYPIGYTQNIQPNMGKQVWASQTEVEMMADYLATLLATKFKNYGRIAIMAHGLGGIVTQLAILHSDEQTLQKISHVMLFGSPNAGIPQILDDKIEGEYTEYLAANSSFITLLRKRWNEAFENQTPFVVRAIAGTDDAFVPTQSNLNAFAQSEQLVIRGDHLSITKPSNSAHESYQVIEQTLLDNQFLHQLTTPEEINLTLGEYQKVVDDLLPRQASLDVQGVKTLCFALEGLDRSKEAMQVLEEHPRIENDGDIIAMLGGRFKREYLKTFSKADAERSFTLYERALQMAQESNDHRLIYYAGVNLAFLSVVWRNDFAAMKQFNELVKTALEHDPFPSLWNIAAAAESALYDAEFDKAKELYTQAAKMAGVRERLSIYTNAYTAYSHLMNTKEPTEPMILFLRNTFL